MEDRVAVIAVHGVADQQPDWTAQATADLLLGLEAGRRYATMSETRERIGVHPVRWSGNTPSVPGGGFSFQAQAVRSQIMESPVVKEDSEIPLAHLVMREQLEDYEAKGKDAIYQSLRLSTRRHANEQSESPDSAGACEVHIYEMFWADLSRLGDKVIGVLFDFYQLLFFLCGLGGRTLNFARAAGGWRGKWWAASSFAQAGCERLLVLAIPLLNLSILGLASALGVRVLMLWDEHLVLPFAVISAIIGGGIVAGGVYALRHNFGPGLWSVSVIGVVLVAAISATGAILLAQNFDFAFKGLAVEFWLVAVLLIGRLLLAFESRWPGAWLWGVGILLILSLKYLFEIFFGQQVNDWPSLFTAATNTVQLGIQFLHWTFWAIFVLFALAFSFASFLAVRFNCPDDECKRLGRRVTWTTNLSIVLPGILVLIVDLALWHGLFRLSRTFLVDQDGDDGLLSLSQMARLDTLINESIPPLFDVGLAIVAAATFLAIWVLLPSVLSEWSEKKSPSRTSWLGESLTKGFKAMRVSGWAVLVLVVVGLLTSFIVRWFKPDNSSAYVLILGTVLFIAITGSHGPFRFLAAGLRAALDIALDVANWLRLDPHGQTTSARICARYVSLLRHVCTWRDPVDGGGYTALVIFAHSQGTVITADLLRFLKIEAKFTDDPDLNRLFRPNEKEPELPIYFFTMGCPLRQLYSLRFPYRYGWARSDLTGPEQVWQNTSKPAPTELGIKVWSNFYRSGDYVGRYLWHSDTEAKEPPNAWTGKDGAAEPWKSESGDRRELCIGAGGHIHYWDETAPEIAAELDWLIERACRQAA